MYIIYIYMQIDCIMVIQTKASNLASLLKSAFVSHSGRKILANQYFFLDQAGPERGIKMAGNSLARGIDVVVDSQLCEMAAKTSFLIKL